MEERKIKKRTKKRYFLLLGIIVANFLAPMISHNLETQIIEGLFIIFIIFMISIIFQKILIINEKINIKVLNNNSINIIEKIFNLLVTLFSYLIFIIFTFSTVVVISYFLK